MLTLLALMLSAARASAQKTVTIVQTDNGTIMADYTIATEGQTVTLTVLPSQGWQLKEGLLLVEKIVNAREAEHPQLSRRTTPNVAEYVNVTKISTDTYTFQMPATDVEVTGLFISTDPTAIQPVNHTLSATSRKYSLAGGRISQPGNRQLIIVNGKKYYWSGFSTKP